MSALPIVVLSISVFPCHRFQHRSGGEGRYAVVAGGDEHGGGGNLTAFKA